ncbi:MAG: TIGR03790 family protein [Pseudomonadales bacterium]|nr:TIGR03790 family protein [Pseudomonadales bacterium]
MINESDPQSLAVGRYYQKARKVPIENIIYVSFLGDDASISAQEFNKIRKVILANSYDGIMAYAITWTKPYKVDCMSLTSALTFGFSNAYCSESCSVTKSSPFYQDDYSLVEPERIRSENRISMMLAGQHEKDVFRTIDIGVGADGSFPVASAYLLESDDKHRNVAAKAYRYQFERRRSDYIRHQFLEKDFLIGKNNILYYSVGRKSVPYLGKNTFLPGAVGDHLTSAGGMLTDSYQMSAIRWLEAGATASYGTVVEPCNMLDKFPNPLIFLDALEAGASLITAYWRSVKMPGQGVFIGEPLAKPFAHKDSVKDL